MSENNYCVEEDIKITSTQDVFDLMANASYNGYSGVVLKKTALPGDFFNLSTGFAGEILQKFANYRMQIGIYGDFSGVKNEAFKAFIRESNRGNTVFFLKTQQDCLDAMQA